MNDYLKYEIEEIIDNIFVDLDNIPEFDTFVIEIEVEIED